MRGLGAFLPSTVLAEWWVNEWSEGQLELSTLIPTAMLSERELLERWRELSLLRVALLLGRNSGN